jgi:hypothetical protein
MKTRDFIYIAIISGLGWLLFEKTKRKKDKSNLDITTPPKGIEDVLDNNLEQAELFGGTKEQAEEYTHTEGEFIGNDFLEYFVIPRTDYDSIYSKVDGRFYYQEKGIIVKSLKVEIPEIKYLQALDFYKKEVLPYKKPDVKK